MSLLVRPGRCVALVGESGAGKSTAAKLAVRFADPDAGAVRLDGHDVRDLTLRSLRDNVALLLQDAPLFDGSVRDNVAYGRPEDDRRPRCWRRSRSLGLQTASTPASASAGARSPAASAGASRWPARCSRTRPCSILDEPSAGLDADATRGLLEPLRRLMADRATLLITHDPILIAAADEVVELRDGRTLELIA